MIGRMIDRGALMLLGTAGMYLLFLNAGMGIPVSCALTFVCVTLVRHLWRHRPRRRRITSTQAEASLLSLVMKGDVEALRILSEKKAATVLIRHPEETFSLNEMFSAWQEIGDGAAIVVTCKTEDAAVDFARSRSIVVVDKKRLVKRIQKTGLYPADAPQGEAVSNRVVRTWRSIRLRPRMIAYGMSLFAAYLATGQALCLVCALALAGIAGAKIIEKYV